VIYLDSAALVKLIRVEAGSGELTEWLSAHAETPLVTSALAEVEVPRAIRRGDPESLPRVQEALAQMHRFEIDAAIRDAAATVGDAAVRGLDAIHLATAQVIGADLEAFVSYDKTLLRAGTALGLPIVSPGA
jgi:predicted nucleic acid-binding protein